MHDQLCLSQSRPLLRLACAIKWGSTGYDEAGRLFNVHRSLLAGGGVAGGMVHLVDGDYTYHHYCQDKFNDKGWGCAYRTFQTLVSWYKHNHYLSSAASATSATTTNTTQQGHQVQVPPSHSTIQQALVDLKEKPYGFVGTSEWIGAIELGFVLDHLYNYQAKIIPVPSGSEIISVAARALARHFDTHGTPVMIGGGQLAYGLLGVDYNDVTGECKFLILDPHYTGEDDITTILQKKWCAWHDISLFIPHAFYNFCLPQRPPNVI